MLLTKGNKSYDATQWSDEKIQNYKNAGWTEAGSTTKKKKPKLELLVEPDVIPADEPTILEENENGSD